MTVQDVLAAASQLSQEERLQVAIRILESIRKSYSVIDCQAEKSSLHDLLSQSPLSRLNFEAESSKSPVRAVEF